jgi:transporter family-2 protein
MLPIYVSACLLGVAVCLQSTVNGRLAGLAGVPLTLILTSATVLAASLAWWLVAPRVERAGGAPWYLFTGGALGVVMLSCAAIAFPRLGAGAATVIAVASQVVTALAVDQLGLAGPRHPLTWTRVVGLALVAVGVALALGAGASSARESP